MADSSERLSFWRKIGFGVGDIYGGGSGVIIGFYYLYFLTDIIRINAALAGIVILISKAYPSASSFRHFLRSCARFCRWRWSSFFPMCTRGIS